MRGRKVVGRKSAMSGRSEKSAPRLARGTQELTPIREEPRLIEDDVAEIVHDLKSPLTAITLEAILLEDKLQRGERQDGLHSVARIHHNIAFLDRLVLDLLDVCSLASGHLELHRSPTDVRELLERVIDRVVPAPHRAHVLLDAPVAIAIEIDELRIERVVSNLIDNALKYTPCTSDIVVRLTPTDDGACVSVIDAGPGITAAQREHIFDRYRRADTSRGRHGYGIGLYVCKKIIEAHGGRVGVESTRHGSRFFFELPSTKVTSARATL
jgi:signal transduction histidine kinase